MPMLDFHALSSTGSTTALANSGGASNISTIAAGGDGATVAGLPIDSTKGSAKLVMWGGATTIADTIADIQLYAQDQWDNVNGEWFTPGASSLLGLYAKETYLPYQKGKRVVSMQQNTGTANNLAFLMDYYDDPSVFTDMGQYFPRKCVERSLTFGGALTAVTWKAQAWAPSAIPPDGKYALLGCYVNALTNYAFVRFVHNDFGQYLPGFPVIDQVNTAVANAVLPKYGFLNNQGYQFKYLSEKSGKPMCPVFHIKAGNTGLSVQAIAITADTPTVTLVIQNLD